MTPADTNRKTIVWPLADLFDALRREGLIVRPDDYLEIVQVLDVFQPQSHTELQALIAPLVVTSADEQEIFDRIFERVWREEGLTPHSVKKKPFPWRWLAGGLLAFLAFGYVAFLWPSPVFKADIQTVSGLAGPLEVGDTLVFAVDSTLRRAAGPMARWQWELPDDSTSLHKNEPEISVISNRTGPLVVKLRSQRRRGLLFTTWTDSLRSMEVPVCAKLPVVQIDTVRLTRSIRSVSYQFTARIGGTTQPIQRTQWRLNGGIVAQNQSVWEHTFPVSSVPAFHDVRFEAIPDTSQQLCFGEASVGVKIGDIAAPSFSIDVQSSGAKIVAKTQLNKLYFWGLWLVGILLSLLIGYYGWLISRDLRRKDSEKKKDPTSSLSPDLDNPLARFASDAPPLEIPLENRETELITRDQAFYQVVRTLRQPAEGDIRRLHIAQTMQATMREGGFPTLVFQPHMAETEYLFLIDRSQVRSQQVALFEYLFRAFLQENVCVERFFFHQKFGTFTNEKHPRGLSLRQLTDTYRSNTLVIWSNGYPLLYPPYPVVEPAIRDALAEWESRAILTPVPFADWGSKERALQSEFLLLPADLTGQLRLMQALAEKQTRQDTYLEQHENDLYSTDYVDFRDVAELREYLGEDLFQWLAALAIYPRIRWETVAGMGRALLPSETVNFTNLLKLARISWMHEGSFPDSTRFALLKELRPGNEAKARQTLLQMLQYSEQYFPGDHFYDGEKYLFQTVNQFTLYAHEPEKYAEYQPSEQAFKTLYDKGLYPDGAMRRYLENPDGEWVTLLPIRFSPLTKAIKSDASQPQNISLQEYFDNLPTQPIEEPPPAEKPTKRNPRRTNAMAAILALSLVFLGLWYTSSSPQNQDIDQDQQIPITIVLDTSACVTALNTSVTDVARWGIFLNDSLYSISNLYATRSFALRTLASEGSTDFEDNGYSGSMWATLSISDTTAGSVRQSRTVQLTGDTLRVRINCQPPPPPPTKLRISLAYASLDAKMQAFMDALAANQSYQFTRPQEPGSYTGRSEVRYFRAEDRAAAEALANQASQLLGIPPVFLVNLSDGSPCPPNCSDENDLRLADLDVRINNEADNQSFVCQNVPISWVSRFNGWQSWGRATYRTITIKGNEMTLDEQSVFKRDIGQTNYAGPQIDVIFSEPILRICEQNKTYLILTTTQVVLIQNVQPDFCDVAIANQNFAPDKIQGQAYFERLLKTASFRRYTPPRQPQSQAAQSGNDYQPNTENLRVTSGKSTDSFIAAGIRAYQRGQYAEAISLYDQSLAKDQVNAYTWNLKGYSLFKLKRYQEAETALLTATKADPNYAWAYFDLARVYCAMNQRTQANDAIRQAIALNPNLEKIMRDDQEFMGLCGDLISSPALRE